MKSIKTKIVLLAGIALIVLSGVLAFNAISSVNKLSIEDAKVIAKSISEAEANKVAKIIDKGMITSRTMADYLQTISKRSDLTGVRKEINLFLENVIINNDDYVGVYAPFEPNALDGKDAEHIGEQGTKNGRFLPYWNKSGSKIGFRAVGHLTDNYYMAPKTTLKEVIDNPAVYNIQGKDVMMTALCAPIIVNGKFLGIAAVDIALDFLQEIADNVKIYNGAGKLAIIANNGTVAAVTGMSNFIGKKLEELTDDTKEHNLYNVVKNGETKMIEDDENLRFFVPIQIGKTVTPWSVSVQIPKTALLAEANKMQTNMIIIGISITLLCLLGIYILQAGW